MRGYVQLFWKAAGKIWKKACDTIWCYRYPNNPILKKRKDRNSITRAVAQRGALQSWKKYII